MHRSPRSWPLILSNAFVAVGAIPAGLALVADPSGGAIGLPVALLEGTPFDGFRVPGLALAFLVGGTALAAAVAHVLAWARARELSLLAGVTLVGWIAIQVALVGPVHALQLLYALIGLAEIGLAVRARAAPSPTPDAATAFLAHRRVAFVGLSTNETDFSRAVAAAMRKRGIEVVPVNPGAQSIGGDACYPSVSAIPDPPKAAFLLVHPSRASGIVDDCVAAGVKAVWFHRGVGAGSATPWAISRAEAAGMLVVQDACPMMFLEPGVWIHRAHRWHREGGWAGEPDQTPPTPSGTRAPGNAASTSA